MMLFPKKENMRFGSTDGFNSDLYYSKLFGAFYRGKLKILLDLLPPQKCGKILEVGFGTGIGLKELSLRARAVSGIDIHHERVKVEAMLKKEGIMNVRLMEHNIFEQPFASDNNFDYIVSSSVFEHIHRDGIKRGVENIYHCLRKDGFLLVGFPLKNMLMDTLFKTYQQTYLRLKKGKIYNFSLEDDHPSGQNEIVPEIERRFTIEEKKYYLNSLFRVYVVLKCKKK